MTRRTLFTLPARRSLPALLSVLTLLGGAGSSAPTALAASARPGALDLAGSYFGLFRSTAGDVWDIDFDVAQQVGRHLDGRISIAGMYRDVVLTGSCSRTHAVTMIGTSGYGAGRVRFKLRGTCHPGSGSDPTTFAGTYLVTGARREQGAFTLAGQMSAR